MLLLDQLKLVNNNYTAYLKISDGCDNRCAYCAIPLIRGNCRSYTIEENVEFEDNKTFLVFNTACFGDVLLCNS